MVTLQLLLFIVCLPCAAQTIHVSDEAILFDSHRVRLPAAEQEFEAAVGGVPVRHEQLADEYSNRVLDWLELGMIAFSNPRTRKVHALDFLLAPQPYWRGLLFCGTIEISGNRITSDTTPTTLKTYGFVVNEEGWYEWRQGCTFVVAEVISERITSIEIGRQQANSVLPPSLRRAENAICAE
jgi:hypothetical protein